MIWAWLTCAYAQTGIDVMENLFGTTNTGAVTGHGGTVVGVSSRGDVTLLTWPSPSGSDQLGHVTGNALDARDQPGFGAPEGSGIQVGLRHAGGVLWLHDPAFTVGQDYGPGDGANIHTRFAHPSGLEVELVDAVHPDVDQWARRITVSGGGPDITDVLVVANFSPVPPDSRIPMLPLADWAVDGRNDFAAGFSGGDLVAWHPSGNRVYTSSFDLLGAPDTDWTELDALMTTAGPSPDALLAGETPDGAWIVLRTDPAPGQVHVGLDETDFCGHFDAMVDNIVALPDIFPGLTPPIDPALLDLLRCTGDGRTLAESRGWTHLPADPWQDAQDGAFAGSRFAAGEVSTGLRIPLPSDGEVLLTTGLGGTLDAARDAAAADDTFDAAEQALASWLGRLTLPGAPGTDIHRVARRALINVRLGTDRDTGAIVASPARQPSYGQDWPRDGAFFSILLDVAGAPELVDQRCDLYAGWQRATAAPADPLLDPPVPPHPETGITGSWPAHAWEMNYFPDGTPGGNLRFEIDTTAFAVWMLVAHTGWTDDPEAHLQRHWETIRTGTDLLAGWRDPANGLQGAAQEDDSAQHTQTLHGAIAVFGALDLASRGARLIGEDADAERWEARATELRAAMERELYDAEAGRFLMDATGRAPFEASGRIPTGPGAWMVWPMPLYPLDHPRIGAQLYGDLAVVRPTIALETAGGAYFLKNLNSLAVAAPYHPIQGAEVGALLQQVALQATPGTDHFGEVMVNVDGVPSQRTANPHLWEGALFALTAYALDDPASLSRWEEVLPPSRVLPVEPLEVEGCGCRTAPAWPSLTGLLRRR